MTAVMTKRAGQGTGTSVSNPVPIWREPVRGGYPDRRMFQLDGHHRDLAGSRGKFPRPPLSHLTGARITHADWEHTLWEQPINGWFLSSQGVVPGGLLAVVADMALGSAISRHLPPRTIFSTSEMSYNFIRRATEQSGTLTAEGRLIKLTGRLALSQAIITDAAGEVVAHGTCRNVLGDQMPASGDVPDPSDQAAVDSYIESLVVPERMEYETPDPYLRPVMGETLSFEHWQSATGREVLEGQIAGNIPMPPIHHLIGIRPTAVRDGEAEFAMPASEWLASGFGSVQGGFIAFLAYSALASAIQTKTEQGMAHVPVDLKVNFLRPVFHDPDLRELTAVGRVIHRGRTLSVADGEVFGVDGKLVAVARGTSMFLPGQPAWGGQ